MLLREKGLSAACVSREAVPLQRLNYYELARQFDFAAQVRGPDINSLVRLVSATGSKAPFQAEMSLHLNKTKTPSRYEIVGH